MRVIRGRARCDVTSLCWLVLGAALAGTWADAATTPHTCFTDRADEHHIEGEWTTEGYIAPYDECKEKALGHPRNSQCNLPTLQAAAGGASLLKRFHATSCMLPPFDATGFARVIGHGATLWFLGDSLMDQQMDSLMCLMHAGGFAIEGTVSAAVRLGPVKCKIMTDTKGSKRSFRMCRSKRFATRSMLSMLLRFNHNAHHTAHQETVVVNFGLHSDTTDYGEVRDALRQWSAYQPTRKLRLVWRDTSPQHFNERGGLFNRTTRNVTLPCLPIDDLRAAFAPYEEVTRMLADFPDVHRLPIWDLTAPRFDAHNPHECTHFCLPGVPDEWNRLLYALLKAQSPSPNAAPEPSRLKTAEYPVLTRERDTL